MACGNLFSGQIQDLPYCLANVLKLHEKTRILRITMVVESERAFNDNGTHELWGQKLSAMESRINWREVR